MDPISITASIIAITTISGKAAKILHSTLTTYGTASLVIASMCSEAAAVSAALTHIQGEINRRPETIMKQLASRPELFATLDATLTGCMAVSTCLEEEAQKLASGASWGAKARLLWTQDMLKQLLDMMRGHRDGLSIIIQALQMESLSDVRDLLQKNSEKLDQIAHCTQSLRSSNRRISILVPESILTTASLHSQQHRLSEDWLASTIGSAEFSFDDIIVNSRAYRSALAAAQQRASKPTSNSKQKPTNQIIITAVSTDGTLQPEEEPALNPKRFVGLDCSICEELLETRLQGERILTTSCGHIHHEICLSLSLHLNDEQARTNCTNCPKCVGADVSRVSKVESYGWSHHDPRPRGYPASVLV